MFIERERDDHGLMCRFGGRVHGERHEVMRKRKETCVASRGVEFGI